MTSLGENISSEILNSQHNIFVFLGALFPLFIILSFKSSVITDLSIKKSTEQIIVSILTVSIGILILFCGRYHFGGFDLSAPIDIGWRVMQGQRPYIDFPITYPPAFTIGSIASFKLFGLNYLSLVKINAVYATLTFIWTYFILRFLTGNSPSSLILSFYIQSVTTMLCSYWWYNPITEISGIIYFLSAWTLLKKPENALNQISYLAALIIFAGMKANLAGVLILGITMIFLTTALRRRVIAITVIAFVVFTIFYQLNGLSIANIITSTLAASERASSLKALYQDNLGLAEITFYIFCITAILAPFIIAILRSKKTTLLTSRLFWLSIVGGLASSYGEITNGESRLMDMPLMLLSAMFGIKEICHLSSIDCKTDFSKQIKTIQSYYLPIALFLLVVGLIFSLNRHRVEMIGYGSFYETQLAKKDVDVPFFKNVYTGTRLVEVVNEIKQILISNKGEKIYFGPRMGWAYASFGIPSPCNQPPTWDPGTTFARINESKYIKNWISQNFELLIFLKNDFLYMSPEFLNSIAVSYAIDQHSPQLTVFHKIK